MHVNKLHIQPQTVNGPKGQKLSRTRGNDSDPGAATDTRKRDLNSGLDPAQPYLADLKSIPEVRADHVEAARARLASGEYTTQQAAAETAAAILRQS